MRFKDTALTDHLYFKIDEHVCISLYHCLCDYEFLVLMFKLSNDGSSFPQLMLKVLGGLLPL